VADRGEDFIALHLGDTCLDLPPELEAPLDREDWDRRYSRYGDTQGEPELRRRLADKLARVNDLPVTDPGELQMSFGATGGLFLAMQRLLEPGDEILVLGPAWTILKVVAAAARVRLVELPFFDRMTDEAPAELGRLIEPHRTSRTRALYFNSPNNPTGAMIDPERLAALAALCRDWDLWVLADEAYEDFVWADTPHRAIAALPDMFERTVSVFSFSKSYAMAGLRLGYLAAPTGVIAALNPGQVGVGYEPNRPAQTAGLRALARREAIVSRLRGAYQEGLRAALANLALPHLPPRGSYYLFLDLRERWAGLSEEKKLERMLAAGVSVSPAEHFGAAYDGWARLCFTAEPPERIAEAARRANRL
jgi:aspartate/methionine/tyrosine aminotransferase